MLKIMYENLDSRKQEYNKYLTEHINNVVKTFEKQLFDNLIIDYDWITVEELNEINDVILSHDASKYSDTEYETYLNYFYPEDGMEKDEVAFNYALLHHYQNNPHHWNHWVLQKDNNIGVPLDMPFKYIVEMVCDWQSMSYKFGGSAHEWYYKNKDKMLLSSYTTTEVEKLLEYLKELI